MSELATFYGWGLSGDLQRVIEYAINPQKTDDKTLVLYKNHSGVLPEAMGLEWKMQRELQGVHKAKITGYHFIHSFPVGSISPEKALETTKELIERITGGRIEYVIGCHVDKEHIHTHSIVNSMFYDTKKSWNIYWKKDLMVFREMSDAVCKEKGLDVIGFTKGRGCHYYEWKIKENGYSEKEIIANVLDYLIPRVKDYKELKECLKKLDFKVEDGLNAKNSEEKFIFTANKILFQEEDDGNDILRIPSTNRTMEIPKKYGEWISSQTCRYVIPMGEVINVRNEEGKKFAQPMTILSGYWENKSKKKREGLRICPSGYKKMIRTVSINENEKGEGYSLEDVISRIQENGRFISDPNITELLSLDTDHARKQIYDKSNIQIRWKDSHLYKSLAQQRFFQWKTSELQKRLNALAYQDLVLKDRKNNKILKEKYSSLLKEMDVISNDLREAEKGYVDMQKERFESDVIISDLEMEKYVREKIKPLQEARMKIREQIGIYKKRIEAIEIRKKER